MRKAIQSLIIITLIVSMAWKSRAVEVDTEVEKRSFLPLIPNSTYTYNGEFKGRKSTDSIVVQTAHVADSDVFYFVNEKDVRNPEAILGTTSIGLGAFIKKTDGIGTLDIFFKQELNTLKKAKIAEAVTVLKNAPENGAVIVVPSPEKATNHTFRVEGNESVTVPAGTFNDCLRMTVEEINLAKPPEKDVVYTGTVWLAKGVGVVKWIRGTGRVEELVTFKLAEVPKK